MQKMVVERLLAARRDETCAFSVPSSHSRSALAFSPTHTHWRCGRRTRSAAPFSQQPPKAYTSPEPRAPSASAQHSLRTPLAHYSAGFTPWVLTRAPQSLRRSRANLETGFSFSRLPPLFFPRSQWVLLWGWAPPASLSAFQAPLLRGCTWQEIHPRARSSSPEQGLGELVLPHAPGPLPHSCRLSGRTGCLPLLQLSLSLSLALFCHWAARGGLRSSLQQRFLTSKQPENLESLRREWTI